MSQESDPIIAKQEQHRSRQDVSLSDYLLLAMFTLLGLLLRLDQLGAIPLSSLESADALSVWNFWNRSGAAAEVTSPAYFALTSLVAQVAGFSDSAMRLGPALVGAMMAPIAWLFRDHIGRRGSLVLALLLATSPFMVMTSRTASADSIALFAISALLLNLLNYRLNRSFLCLASAGASLSLGLTSSALFLSMLVSLLLSAAVLALTGAIRPTAQLRKASWTAPASVALGTFLLVSTSLLMLPNGLGQSIHIWLDWLGGLQDPIGLGTRMIGFSSLLRYEFSLLLLIPVLLMARPRLGRGIVKFLAIWILLAIFLLFFQSRSPLAPAMIVLPALLLLSVNAESAINESSSPGWLELSAVISVAAILFANGRSLFDSIEAMELSTRILMIGIILALALAVAILLHSRGLLRPAQGVLAFILILFSVATSWYMGHTGMGDISELAVRQATSPQLVEVSEMLAQISVDAHGSRDELSIARSISSPPVNWYLRDFAGMANGSSDAGASVDAEVTSTTASPGFAGEFTGMDFTVGTSSLATNGALELDFSRQWLRERSTVLDEERAVLWVRSSLFLQAIGSE